ncbi:MULTISPECIES: hypothetical protein [unclassified Caulobacter]|uniref:hypothetical protein n=1 Tax=unclassified Caulobacter TaxID=2648921 RepID=UPI000D36A227|nr:MULTISPECIES: hypothetical protein [unclassified Caulobacter]PTS89062.1 hypothetical protein DBR21_07600 [Caulobacter sp. HMWF009]PTT05041.1 hypothetical protein DBR10_16725 [Caulobacter sp. HMWF025]
MPVGQSSKKTETIEIRLPPETKAAFMARCQSTRRTASETLRSFIDQDLGGRVQAPRRHGLVWHALAAAVAGLAVGAVAAPSLARTAGSDAAFHRLDRNHDGQLSVEEFRAR